MEKKDERLERILSSYDDAISKIARELYKEIRNGKQTYKEVKNELVRFKKVARWQANSEKYDYLLKVAESLLEEEMNDLPLTNRSE